MPIKNERKKYQFQAQISCVGRALCERLALEYGLPMTGLVETLARRQAKKMRIYRKVGQNTDWDAVIVRRSGAAPGVPPDRPYLQDGEQTLLQLVLTPPCYYYVQQVAHKRGITLSAAIEWLVRECAKEEKIKEA